MTRDPARSARRRFLRQGAGLALAGPLSALAATPLERVRLAQSPDYGPLRTVADQTTGLPLLRLPAGFSYLSHGWTGQPMADGRPTPARPDGMAVIDQQVGRLRLIRNHEIAEDSPSIAPPELTYDPRAGGGCTLLEFDPRAGTWGDDRVLLGGTSNNCAGGATPWGSWLSCEETLAEPGLLNRFEKRHGWVFEVPLDRPAEPVPLQAMGRFLHEAVAVDPASGHLFLTEDDRPSGLFRFIPEQPGRLAAGGRLQVLRIGGLRHADLRNRHAPRQIEAGADLPVEWANIEDPAATRRSIREQCTELGAARFARLEGIWHEGGRILFTATEGGPGQHGQVWALTPANDRLGLVFESTDPQRLQHPDNLCVSPRGGILLCEDGGRRVPPRGDQLVGLSDDGRLYPFAENAVVLDGFGGFRGDYRGSEWAGAGFSRDGRWLFANIQVPGISFAITGPWENGPL